MKEATGELNMTVITVVAIGAVMVFFYLVIWPSIQNGMVLNSACNTSGGNKYSQTTDDGSISCSNGSCTYTTNDGKTTTKTCTD